MNVKQNLSILFYRKTKKKNNSGEIPIYARITIDGFKDEFSTGIKVLLEQWDNKTKTVFTFVPNHKLINKKIGQIKADLERHFDLVQAKQGTATPQAVKISYLTPINGQENQSHRRENFLLSESLDETVYSYLKWCDKFDKAHKDGNRPRPEKMELLLQEKLELKEVLKKLEKKASTVFEDKSRQKTLIMALDEYLLNFTVLALEGHRSPNTLEKWIGRKKRYLAFLQHKFKTSDIPLVQLEFKYLNDLVKYLYTYHSVNENTAMKYAQCIKELMDRCVANGWVTANIFTTFECSYTKTNRPWPSMTEMETFIHFEFSKEIYNTVRDIAIFQSFTGYGYNETYLAEPADVYLGFDGQHWIDKDRQKTGTEEAVPLLPIALEIIDKYKEHPQCLRTGRILPVPTNEYYNRCLKEMGKEMGTNNFDNTHRFRYFFANEVTFNMGVPLKTVSKIVGHKSVTATETYVRPNKVNISENMKMVKEKLFTADGRLKSLKSTPIERTTACGLKVVHLQKNGAISD